VYQEHFLRWLGFTIVGSYGRADDLAPDTIIELIKAGKRHKIRSVIDTIQSGETTGLMIAKEIPAAYCALTNFPQNESYLEAVQKNIDKLLECTK